MGKNKSNLNSGVEETKCPNCGAPLSYNPDAGTLTCKNCGSKIDLGYWQDHKISGFNFEDVENYVTLENAADIPVYNCISCGAEILAAKEEVAMTCPYCGNNIVLTDKISGKLRPNAIIPFKITPDKLPDALHRFYKDKVLLPKDYFPKSKIGKITGIYVPFWCFTGDVSGDLSYVAETNRYYTTATEQITENREYKLLRNASVSFQNLLLDASEKMDDALMDSVLPYDLSEAKPFNMAYLAGFAADRFDVRSEKLAQRAEERMRKSAYDAVQPMVASEGYSMVRLTGGALKARMQDVKYLLLPVYVFDINYGRPMHYAVNGQTGKVVGSTPINKKTCKRYRRTRAAIAFAAVMAVSAAIYFLGGI